ncbi:tetratricopeptide repeat protein [Mangrovibacterium sp.]|uniref:tetratricopeptide repeat protein n=1 Tax=Mangrovibacterium sp. TaxID=1961364 RepID=UPI0035686078
MEFLKKNSGIAMLLMVLVVTACSTSKVVITKLELATQAEAEGNYNGATEAWSSYFDEQLTKGREILAESYARAGKTAVKAGRTELAESWMSKARRDGYSDPEMELELARIYRSRNELPKELSTLEIFKSKYPENQGVEEVNGRLFKIYSMLKDDQKAKVIWIYLTDKQRQDKEFLEDYFKIVAKRNDMVETISVAKELVKADSNNVAALEWLAQTYYNRAENSYQAEMAAYKQTHTHLQYLHLTQELKVINANFQESLEYFTKLWEIEQKAAYAAYISNIYTRFDNKQKADYFRKFVQ